MKHRERRYPKTEVEIQQAVKRVQTERITKGVLEISGYLSAIIDGCELEANRRNDGTTAEELFEQTLNLLVKLAWVLHKNKKDDQGDCISR